MRDLNILRHVAGTLWALTEDKWAELMPVLIRHARGERLSAEDISARLGDAAPASPSKRGSVAVIPIRGVIAHRMDALEASSGGTSAEQIGAMIDAIAGDPSIGTIVYDVDSPGGTVPGIQELAGKMYALRGQKQQIAVSNSLMASAAYWLASQADEIVSIPSGTVGSIGVFSAHQDVSAALEKEGIKVTLIKAGKFKTEGNPFEPLSDEAKEVIQERVDAAYSLFVKDVARGRWVSVADVKGGFGQGRALQAKDAKAAGLIDRIGTFDETLSKAVGRKVSAAMRAETGELMEVCEDFEASLDATREAEPHSDDAADMERRLRSL